MQLKQLLTEEKTIGENEFSFLRLLLNECESELNSIQQEISISLTDATSTEPVSIIEDNSITNDEDENSDTQEESPTVPLHVRSTSLKQKAELREQISELENKIMALVDQDMFEEADALEQQRIQVQAVLNSL